MSLVTSRNGMIGAQQRLQHTASNLANVNSTGYTREFPHHLSQAKNSGSKTGNTTLDMSRGSFKSTGRSLDLTTSNRQFFELGSGENTRFTRTGRFGLDQRGQIVHLSSGLKLQGKQGDLRADSPEQFKELNIDQDGTVTGKRPNGDTETIGTIELVRFQNPAGLNRSRAGLLAKTPNSGEPSVVNEQGKKTVLSGRLETSNVSLVESVTDQQRTLRSFQMNVKAFQAQNEILQRLTTLR